MTAALAELERVHRHVLLVGEVNPYGEDPKFALYDLPERASGHRLRLILGLPRREYLALRKVNLCTGQWTMRQARARAELIIARHPPWDGVAVIVLLGRRVATAFDYGAGFFTREEWEVGPGQADCPLRVVSLPHPSGLSRMWNDPTSRPRALALLRAVAPGASWGDES